MSHISFGMIVLACAAVLAITGIARAVVAGTVQVTHISASGPDNGPWPAPQG
jgi:hypothetical protein